MKLKTYKAPPALSGYGDLLTIVDLQRLTGLHPDTLRGLIKRGRLPGVRIGQRYYVPKTRLLEFLDGGIDA